MKQQHGFTLYELLTVIGIVTILAAIATPNVLTWRSETKLRSALNNLRTDLQMAKSWALREKAIVAVLFTASDYKIFIDNGAGAHAGNWNLDADEALLKDKRLPAGVTIKLPTSLDSPHNRTRFNGRGFPDPTTLTGGGFTGTVTLQNSNGSRKQVRLNRLGRINDA
jgi:prepilin-type N-terminal cleavage/methylation domain-containing protein